MGAPLLTAADVRADLGRKADGLSDDELIEIARRVRVVTTAMLSKTSTTTEADIALWRRRQQIGTEA